MKKFTENIDSSGHHDNYGNFVPETLCASLRNKLTPLFNLSTMLNNYETFDNVKKDEILKYIIEESKNCENVKPKILEIIKELENKE